MKCPFKDLECGKCETCPIYLELCPKCGAHKKNYREMMHEECCKEEK